ncbi:MAG: hypothetical protein Q7U47_01025 [Paludibacter sp.]|nr:hypothetical protein [Paludibacter sp.]
MQKLSNQIVESFFNPLFHFLPLLIFVVMGDVWGFNTAWKVAFAVNIILLIYIYFRYRRITDWFLYSTAIFFVIATIVLSFPSHFLNSSISHLTAELVVLIFFTGSLMLRKFIHKLTIQFSPKNFSMLNNLDELFRLMWIFTILFFVYILSVLIFVLDNPENLKTIQDFIFSLYIIAIVVIIVYEIIRVTIVRIRLLKEEWWPIVNEQGKMIGSIHHLTSLNDERKYIHPIIRVILIDKNKIFLQKHCQDDLVFAGLWDTAISNHVFLNEKIEHCIVRTATEQYGIKNMKPIFLSHYIHETPQEILYAYIFVACKYSNLTPNPRCFEQTKWWTLQQIEDNLNSGIFTENFLIELNYLKRSGLLESGKCECECKIKETINQNINKAI